MFQQSLSATKITAIVEVHSVRQTWNHRMLTVVVLVSGVLAALAARVPVLVVVAEPLGVGHHLPAGAPVVKCASVVPRPAEVW